MYEKRSRRNFELLEHNDKHIWNKFNGKLYI